MKRKTGLSCCFSRSRVGKSCSGYTLLEILVAISLMLMLMYAVAAIFGRVGTIMNETRGAMTLASGLRNTCRRLESDLKMVTVPMKPPRNSNNNEGYFCLTEGLGASFQRIFNTGAPYSAGTDIALDTERGVSDTTVGDMDDILMFTAKAPAGQLFRGRFLRPIYNNVGVITGVQQEMIESEYAEVIWFVRGTTLYRRVLLIIPQEKLEEGLKAADWHAINNGYGVSLRELNPGATGSSIRDAVSPVRLGYGFHYFFDVSVHLERFDKPTASAFDGARPNDPDGTYAYPYGTNRTAYELERVVANTLGDLSNRKNRYGYWSSVCGHAANNVNLVDTTNIRGFGKLHGNTGAWYWLRLPTLQESATFVPSTAQENRIQAYRHSFRAGLPFGGGMAERSRWRGINQTLKHPAGDADQLPIPANPFLDYWNDPNGWEETDIESGDLNYSFTAGVGKIFDQDVILTNVLSFNVKAWDENTRQFVELGNQFSLGRHQYSTNALFDDTNPSHSTYLASFPKDFKTVGAYRPFTFTPNNVVDTAYNVGGESQIYSPFLPAVYDTWTEQYELEWLYKTKIDPAGPTTYYPTSDVSNIPTEGNITSAQLPHFPPPYDIPLKAVQIEIRAFDPKLKIIRNMTFQVEFPEW